MIKTKKIKIISLLIALAFFATNLAFVFPFLTTSSKSLSVDATSIANDYANELTLSNGNFSSTSGSSSIKTPSSWSVVDSRHSNLVKAGVIDVTPSVFNVKSEDYGLTSNPSSPANSIGTNDSNVLMINSEENLLSYGYYSSSLTLKSDSFYVISFFANVDTNGANGASAYLVSDDLENTVSNSFVNFTTKTNGASIWQQYSFYVVTGNKDLDVQLQLYLGSKTSSFNSKGAVFFDNCKAVEYSENTFEELSDFYTNTTSRYIYLGSELDFSNQFANGSFEEATDGNWSVITTATSNNTKYGTTSVNASTFDKTTTGISTAPESNLRQAKVLANSMTNQPNQKALYISNPNNETSTGYKSNSVMFERMKSYEISLYVKTGALSTNGASILLTEVVDEDETADYKSEFTSVTTNSYTNAISNDWAKYTYYVLGSPYDDIELELQLWLGSKSLNTRGYVFFDEVVVKEIPQSVYSSASEGTYIKKLSLSSISESQSIENGAFNLSEGENEVAGIYTPSSWTNKSNNSELKAKYNGIINTQTYLFDMSETGLAPAQNPGKLPTVNSSLTNDQVSNNVLMIRNIAQGSQYFESATFSLSASTSYEISLYAYALNSNNVRIIVLDDSNNTLAKFENISSASWQNYRTLIKVGASAVTAKIQLWLGSETNKTAGYAFFDNVSFASTTTDIYSVGTTQFSRIVDFEVDNFENTDLNATNSIFEAYLWTKTTGENNVASGIVNANNQDVISENINVTDSQKSKILFISSANDVNYSLTSKTSYSLSSESFYKVIIRLKTFNIARTTSNTQLNTTTTMPYGAYLSLTNLEGAFEGINTQTNNGSEWKDYTFFVSTGANSYTTQIVISLGNKDALTSGTVCVEKVQLQSIEEASYTEGIKTLSSNYPETNVLNIVASESAEEEEEEETSSGANFGLIDMAGVILGIALLVAILGTLIRRARKNKKATVKVNKTYDRGQTKSAEQKITKYDTRIKELNEQIAVIDEEMSETKANLFEYNQKLENADKDDVVKIKREIEKAEEKLAIIKDNMMAVEQEKLALQEKINHEREKRTSSSKKSK